MTFSLKTFSIFLLVLILPIPPMASVASAQVARFVEVVDDDKNGDEDEDEDEDDEEDFMNNPWQIDERKMFAAKKFQLSNEFALKMKQIDDLCGLDKKQKLKLSIASKGATEKALEAFEKQWEQQLGQFGGQFGANNGKKKKKKRKKKKQIVIKNVDEIDAQIMQMLDQSFIGGIVKNEPSDVALWKRTVKKVLNEEQRKKLDEHMKSLKLARKNARADSFITEMKGKLVLADDQIKKFDELVRPAFMKKDINVTWQYEFMATLYLGSLHDKKEMKKLLSKEQHTALQITLKPAEGYAGFFGDNNNMVVGQVVAANDPVEWILGEAIGNFLDNLENVAQFLERSMQGVFK